MTDVSPLDSRSSSSRSIKPCLLIVSGIFVAGFLVGYFVPVPGKLEFFGEFAEAHGPYGDLTPFWLFFAILANNASKSFLLMLSGILFGILPVGSALVNGYILGVAVLWAMGQAGTGEVLKAILPHGVLEIPALILSMAYGLWLGVVFTKRIGQRNWEGTGGQVRHAIAIYFKIAFPLFVAAALVEVVVIGMMG